jgi:hypothetical protein
VGNSLRLLNKTDDLANPSIIAGLKGIADGATIDDKSK